jgi:hypothetical protein
MVVVPCLGCSWRNARYLPAGRDQAGDRHFKFHDERDNLRKFRAPELLRGPSESLAQPLSPDISGGASEAGLARSTRAAAHHGGDPEAP